VRRRGADFLREWAEMMTGAKSKSSLLRPNLALPMLREIAKQWLS
jgi:hypothetical protein